jgi:hypothetical protein
MISSLETSLSSLNTHGLMAQAQQQLTGPTAEPGRLPLSCDAVAPVEPAPSLLLNAEALKAQEEALSLLDRVFSAANAVFTELLPLWEARQSLGPTPEPAMAAHAELIDHRLRDLMQNSRFEGAALFDLGQVNAETLGNLLRQPPQTSRIELFSAELRSRLTDAFERAFDVYA